MKVVEDDNTLDRDTLIAGVRRFCATAAGVFLFVSLLVSAVFLLRHIITWWEHGYWSAPSTGEILVGLEYEPHWLYHAADPNMFTEAVVWFFDLPIWIAALLGGIVVALILWLVSKVI